MNQKDYKAIAEILKKSHDWEQKGGIGINDAILKFADYFEKENYQQRIDNKLTGVAWSNNAFDKKQFLKDCGIEE